MKSARNRLSLRQAGLEREGWLSHQGSWLADRAASAVEALQSALAGLREPQEQCCAG